MLFCCALTLFCCVDFFPVCSVVFRVGEGTEGDVVRPANSGKIELCGYRLV